MCGIFFYKGNKYYKNNLLYNFNAIYNRGPDSSNIINIDDTIMGFHRLAINDLSASGMQPFINNDIYLICNGEIYNHDTIRREHFFVSKSHSDCEVIIHLYQLYGIEKTCQLLDGVFSFVLYDKKLETVYVARDPYGVRPLFIGNTIDHDIFVCSELKGIHDITIHVKQFTPVFYLEYDLD